MIHGRLNVVAPARVYLSVRALKTQFMKAKGTISSLTSFEAGPGAASAHPADAPAPSISMTTLAA
jgi:hypothetical protein